MLSEHVRTKDPAPITKDHLAKPLLSLPL